MDYCYLLDVILCGLVVIAELFGAVVLALTVQFLFLKLFKINLYKLINKKLNKLDKKLNKYFNNQGGKNMNNVITNDFLKSITKKAKNEIIAYFENGQKVTYTMNVFEMLKEEKDIKYITNAETGEIIW